MTNLKIHKTLTIGFIAALTLVGCSAPNEVAPPVEEPAEVEEVIEEEPVADVEGSRENPHPIGSAITDGDWTVIVNSVEMDATEAILSHNEFNDPPADGSVYILVNATVTYNGSEAQGEMPWAEINYITADGNTVEQAWQDIPDDFTLLTELYEGASHTGNLAFEVPADTATEGVLAVMPGMMSERSFVALS